jgi:hypothetical protein
MLPNFTCSLDFFAQPLPENEPNIYLKARRREQRSKHENSSDKIRFASCRRRIGRCADIERRSSR